MTGATRVVLNASSGQGRPQGWDRELAHKLAARGLQAEVTLVRSGREISEATQRALQDRVARVIACGGDGTVSAVASKVAGSGVALGVLPTGTLNHFAKDLGLPLDLDAAIDVIATGREKGVDVGEVNGRVFINNSSLGLYPDIVLDRERQRRRLGRGKWMALLAASLHALHRYPVLSLAMQADGRPLRRRSSFVFIGNNEYRMEGFEIGERAGLSDGVLSLYVTQRTGRFGLLRLAVRALFGRLRQARDFDMLRVAEVVIDTPRHRVHVAADGELLVMETPLTYRIRPAALRVIVPAYP